MKYTKEYIIDGYKKLYFCMRYDFDASLIERCRDAGVSLRCGESAATINLEENILTLTGGEQLNFDVLIGADGVNSQVAKQIFIGPQAARAGMNAAIPLIEYESESPAFSLLLEQFPAEFVVILLLRTNVENDVRHRQHGNEFLAIGQIVAVDVRRIDDDLIDE